MTSISFTPFPPDDNDTVTLTHHGDCKPFCSLIEAPIPPQIASSAGYDASTIQRDRLSAQSANTRTRESPLRVTAKRPTQKSVAIALALYATLPAHACWNEAAARYQVNGDLLQAIAKTESAMNPRAARRNRNGSRDIGLMQINSAWLPILATYGITERDLFEPCTNINVGAWVLAGNVFRLGYTWEAVGAYNAVRPALRQAYIEKVRRHLPPAAGAIASVARHDPAISGR